MIFGMRMADGEGRSTGQAEMSEAELRAARQAAQGTRTETGREQRRKGKYARKQRKREEAAAQGAGADGAERGGGEE